MVSLEKAFMDIPMDLRNLLILQTSGILPRCKLIRETEIAEQPQKALIIVLYLLREMNRSKRDMVMGFLRVVPCILEFLNALANGRFGGDPAIYGANTKTKRIERFYSFLAQPSCPTSPTDSNECFIGVAKAGFKVSKNVSLEAASNEIPTGCSVQESNGEWVATYNKFQSSKQCSTSKQRLGQLKFDIGVTVKVELTSVATITLSGPSNVWFGVGFNAANMADSPYTIIVNSTGVYERQIGTCGSEAEHCPGDALQKSVTIVSNAVSDGVRTTVMTRPLKGLTKHHFTFDATKDAQLKFISAVGSSQEFAYHKAHSTGIMSLLSDKEPNCLCEVGQTGYMCDNNGQNCDTFVKNCVASPAGELLSQRNPTCNSIQYAGGLRCCHHKRIMLDADQPIRPELLRYHMKFRFWFQEYKVVGNEVSHNDLPRIYYQTEAWAGEYDIPPAFAKPGHPVAGYPNWPLNTPTPGTKCTGNCPDGDDCACVHTIVYKWNVSNMRLIYAGGHCHAPACIQMELYRNDTGHEMELLCRQIPVYGKGNVKDDKYDEEGYIALPPCLWGDDEGLEPSILLPANTPLVSIKHNRNTKMGHYGEMASWQMRGVNF